MSAEQQTPEEIEGEGRELEQSAGNGHSVAPVVPPTPPQLAVTPQVEASELVARMDVIRKATDTAMVRDVDYGRVPGTDKPTLFKPGAEKLSVLFQLDVQLVNDKTWGPGEHLTVISQATVFHAPSGARLGYGEGVCTTRERKYAKRKQERKCPACGAEAVIKGKAEYGGGWLCWKKRDGCGAKFADGDESIEGQEVGEIDNPDLPDLWNTIVKMAEKRARVDAVLAVTGASALFTQDVEDMVAPEAAPPELQEAPKTEAQPAQKSERPATGKQKGLINALSEKAGLEEKEQKALVQWVGGVAYLDRMSSKKASELIEAMGKGGAGVVDIVAEINAKAADGDKRAKAIQERYLSGGAS